MATNYSPTNDPNYMGALKEPSRFDFNGGQKYDNLFSGLTEGIKGIVGSADELVKGLIKSDVYEGVDKLRGAQGVDVDAKTAAGGGTAGQAPNATVFRGTPGPDPAGGSGGAGGSDPMAANKPPNQEAIAGEYARVKAAYDQGKISDRNYYAQLEVMNRSLRSRYPGYREEVDAMVHSVTGVVPANALRKAVLTDLQSAQSNADALTKERQKMLMANPEYFPADAMKREAAGNPYSMAELYSFKQPRVIEQEQVKDAKARLELKSAQGSAASTDALQVANLAMGRVTNTILNNASNNQSAAALMKKITDYQAQGKVLSPEEQQQMLATFQQLKYQTRAAMEAAFNEPLTPGSKMTLRGSINDQGKITQLIDAQMQPFDMIEKGLTDNNLGLINVSLNATKNMQNADLKKVYESSGYLRAISTIKAFGGDELIKQLATRPETGLASEGAKSVLQIFKTLNLTAGQHSQSGTTSWEEQFKTLGDLPDGKKPATIKQFVNDRVSELTDPSVPAALKANAAKVAFSPENVNFLNKFQAKDGTQAKLFTQLVSPAVTKSMMTLRDTHPEGAAIWKNYSEWAKNNFIGLFKQAGDDISSVKDRQWLNVNWNPVAKQFEVTPTEAGIKANSEYPGRSLVTSIESRLQSNVTTSVERMNQGIKAIAPVLEANGFKTEDEIKKLVNFNALATKSEDNFWKRMVRNATDPKNSLFQAKPDDRFGGSPVNFTQPPGGGKAGRLSTEKDPASDLVNKRGADLDNISDKADKMLNGLINEGVVDKIAVTSGYRDPDRNAIAGGARYSKHIDGDAIDLHIGHYTDAQKTALLETAIRHGAKGIGVYPGGTSLHIDTRETPATWGYSPFGKYKGVHWSSQPAWAQGPLKKLFGE